MPTAKDRTIQDPSNPNKTVALTTVAVVFGGTIALVAPFVFLSSTKARPFSPYIATPSRKLRRAFNFIASTTSPSKRRMFLDLGSGDGESVYQAVQQQTREHQPLFHTAVGVELNSTLYFLSQLRRYSSWKTDERRRSTFYCRDMWKFQDQLSDYDTIFVSQIPAVQSRLGKMIAQECNPGTFLLSYRFHGMMDDEELRAKLIYDDEEHLRIYQVLVPENFVTDVEDIQERETDGTAQQ